MSYQYIVFTDLDGTLLDVDSYSYAPAIEALKFLKEKKYPVIPCTSKTHIEVEALLHTMGSHDPYITENGSALFFESTYFPSQPADSHTKETQTIIFGKQHKEVFRFMNILKDKFHIPLLGISEMSLSEISALTSLAENEAKDAAVRYFSEPFILTDSFVFNREVVAYITDNGFRLLKGNRFYHLLGNCDKGLALKRTAQMFKENLTEPAKLITVAIGDSKNDLDMLRAADIPIVVRQKDGSHLDASSIARVYYTEKVGPAGWAEAVFKWIAQGENPL